MLLRKLILLECADMDNNLYYKNTLRQLCIKMIELLDELKVNGLIGEEDYQQHVCKKKDFLNNFD
jgi:hypothetical protein